MAAAKQYCWKLDLKTKQSILKASVELITLILLVIELKAHVRLVDIYLSAAQHQILSCSHLHTNICFIQNVYERIIFASWHL